MSDVDLKRYLDVVWKWLWLIGIATVLAAGASYYASKWMPVIYRTSITLLVGDTVGSPNLNYSDVSTSQRLATAYAEMVRRQPILDATVNALGLRMNWLELQNLVTVNHADGTQIFEILVVGTDPQGVKTIADEIARQLILQSPTAENLQEMEERRQFVQRQLDDLQKKIQQAETTLLEKQAALAKEVSARGVLDRQDEIRALEINISSWRSTYASLLSTYQAKRPNTLTVIEPAFVPTKPISPNVPANVMMAIALGFLLALGTAFLIEYLNDTLSVPEDVTRVLDLPNLGSILDMGKIEASSDLLITASSPRSQISEAYRLIRTNIQFACVDDDSITLLVTSPGINEGKSTVCANLAVSFAQVGKRTILVDVDLRHPSLHTFFGGVNDVGLTSLLIDEPVQQTKGEIVQQAGAAEQLKRWLEARLAPTEVPGLWVLPTGTIPPNDAELLASSRMEQLLKGLQDIADVVILDSPPVLPVADTGILAAKGAGVILVVEAGKTRIPAAREAKETLLRANARLLGVVLNKVPRSSVSCYRYRYYETDWKRQSLQLRPLQLAQKAALSLRSNLPQFVKRNDRRWWRPGQRWKPER